ncbi:MAG: hypothetical protein FWE94_06140 [Coriobacteriia bacterium]|nr:hypothetical protein [Coriobacteriia bacterium]
MDVDRRAFVRTAGGLVIFVVSSALVGVGLAKTAILLSSDDPSRNNRDPRGPLLAEGITFAPVEAGVDAFVGDVHVFSANETGAILLAAADGTRTLDEIVAEVGGSIGPVEAALFYIELGEAGYLQNRVEVALVEHSA